MASKIWGPGAAAAVVLFVPVEPRQASPLMPFRLLGKTGARRPVVTMFFLGGAMTAIFFVATCNLQRLHGLIPWPPGLRSWHCRWANSQLLPPPIYCNNVSA